MKLTVSVLQKAFEKQTNIAPYKVASAGKMHIPVIRFYFSRSLLHSAFPAGIILQMYTIAQYITSRLHFYQKYIKTEIWRFSLRSDNLFPSALKTLQCRIGPVTVEQEGLKVLLKDTSGRWTHEWESSSWRLSSQSSSAGSQWTRKSYCKNKIKSLE